MPIRQGLRRQQHRLVARVFRAQAGTGEFPVDISDSGAIAWIMERYQVKTDKKSGIKNDPNDWAKEVGNPRYTLNLLLSIINVSVQTVDIVSGLPKLDFED